MRKCLVPICASLIVIGSAFADPQDLGGGAFIAHFPTGMVYSSSPPTGGWCQQYQNGYRLEDCQDQVNRIDTGEQVIWFVLAAWNEQKQWCGTEFGFGEYDPAAFVITDFGPCWPDEGLEIPTASWPGPEEGTALVTSGSPWEGNLVPVYWFAGYAYEEGLIPLAADPGTGFAGTANCANPPQSWAADSLGAIGLFRDGVFACPQGGSTLPEGGGISGSEGGSEFLIGGDPLPDSSAITFVELATTTTSAFMEALRSLKEAYGLHVLVGLAPDGLIWSAPLTLDTRTPWL